jgi:hypothetical protein
MPEKDGGNMSPIVRLVNDGEKYEEVFVSLERTPVVIAKVRRNLPQLKKDLRKKWAVENVQIGNRIPRRRNPYDPSQVVEAACLGLLISIALPAGRAASRKLGEAVGDEIAKHVRRWIRSIGKSRPRRRSGSARIRKMGSRP